MRGKGRRGQKRAEEGGERAGEGGERAGERAGEGGESSIGQWNKVWRAGWDQ